MRLEKVLVHILVQNRKHLPAAHVMTKQDAAQGWVIRVALVIHKGQPRVAVVAVKVLMQVLFLVFRRMHHRVVHNGIVNANPTGHIRIFGRQFLIIGQNRILRCHRFRRGDRHCRTGGRRGVCRRLRRGLDCRRAVRRLRRSGGSGCSLRCRGNRRGLRRSLQPRQVILIALQALGVPVCADGVQHQPDGAAYKHRQRNPP